MDIDYNINIRLSQVAIYLVTLCPTIFKSAKVVVIFFKDALLVSSELHFRSRTGCPFSSTMQEQKERERRTERSTRFEFTFVCLQDILHVIPG